VAGGIEKVRAIIADDERLLRDQLIGCLREVWPELELVAQARNGQEAVDLVAQFKPDVVFLDIRMPGLTGIEAAAQIIQMDFGADRCPPEIVFVTAFDQYAVQAFERGGGGLCPEARTTRAAALDGGQTPATLRPRYASDPTPSASAAVSTAQPKHFQR
jgi:DNA-binding LytR/AlgR family response regulator